MPTAPAKVLMHALAGGCSLCESRGIVIGLLQLQHPLRAMAIDHVFHYHCLVCHKTFSAVGKHILAVSAGHCRGKEHKEWLAYWQERVSGGQLRLPFTSDMT